MIHCTKTIFTNRACNAIISETIAKSPGQASGILLGRIINSTCYVAEAIDSGPAITGNTDDCRNDMTYFYHVAKILSKQYKIELEVLGRWLGNATSDSFLDINKQHGHSPFAAIHPTSVISALIKIHPTFCLAVYPLIASSKNEKIAFEVGDHLMPDSLLEYKHLEETRLINFNQYCLPFVSSNSQPASSLF